MNWAGRRALVAAAAATMAVLAGCGGTVTGTAVAGADGTGDSSTVETSPTTPQEPTGTDEPTERPDTDDGDVTAPDAVLAVGDTATVEFKGRDDEIGIIRVTVHEVEQGDLSDLSDAGFTIEDNMKSRVPHYVHATFENVSVPSGGTPRIGVFAFDDQGDSEGVLTLFGRFERCSAGDRSNFDEGQSFDSCLVYLLPEGRSLEQVGYAGFGTDYRRNPVLWQI